MSRFYLAASLLLLVACGRSSAPEPRSLAAVQKIMAEQLNRPVAEIRADSTMAALGMDDLDFVEVVMATEEALDISINDAVIAQAAGVTHIEKAAASLTVTAFAALADASPHQAPAAAGTEPKDGGLRANQVGKFGELSKLPNPRGHELVFVPAWDELVVMTESKSGHKLSAEETLKLKNNAVVMAVPPAIAAKFRAKGHESQRAR